MQDPSGGHAAEEYLPENLRRLCESKGISQAALAKAMAARGWPWHQQTAYKAINGKRGIGTGELIDLAHILGVSTGQLTWSGPEANEAGMVNRAIVILRREWEEAAQAVHRLLAARALAERTLAQRGGSKYQRVRDTCAELALDFGDRTLQNAVDEGCARYEHPEEEP